MDLPAVNEHLRLIVFMILLVYLVSVLYERLRIGDGFALLLAAALSGFPAIGVSASLFDEPRLTLLFFLTVWLALLQSPRPAGFNRGRVRCDNSGARPAARPWRYIKI